MTISADSVAASCEVLESALELYRDLTVALRGRITGIKDTIDQAVDSEMEAAALRSHRKALQTVLDIEASLGKSTRKWAEGSGGELDLDAARAEILARLAVWSAEG